MRDRINKIFEMLEGESDVSEVRSECIQIGIELAEQFGDDIDPWEKSQLASAISSLNWNLSFDHPTTETGLRLCTHSLNKALEPKDHRSPDYPVNENDLKNVSTQEIIEAFRSL